MFILFLRSFHNGITQFGTSIVQPLRKYECGINCACAGVWEDAPQSYLLSPNLRFSEGG